jgi:hypothetical protein
MKNNAKFGFLGLVLICLTVSAIFGIAYAAFTKSLNISGSASVSSTKWDVHFTSMTLNTTNTTSGLTTTTPTVTGTTISGWGGTFTKPGQKIEYDAVITNAGDFDARFNHFSDYATVTCKVGNDATATSAVNVCKYMKYDIKKSDNSSISIQDIVSSGGTYNIKVSLEYTDSLYVNKEYVDITPTELPTEAVTVTVSPTTLVFSQE